MYKVWADSYYFYVVQHFKYCAFKHQWSKICSKKFEDVNSLELPGFFILLQSPAFMFSFELKPDVLVVSSQMMRGLFSTWTPLHNSCVLVGLDHQVHFVPINVVNCRMLYHEFYMQCCNWKIFKWNSILFVAISPSTDIFLHLYAARQKCACIVMQS